MSTETKQPVLARLRRRYAPAGLEHTGQLLNQAVEVLGYPRQAAIRALRAALPPPRPPALLWGRPKTYPPGRLLRQSIPIRGEWTEEGPGWLELDPVALCGGALDDLHLWMFDAVDIRSAWGGGKLRAEHARLNPFQLAREGERTQKAIVAQRQLTARKESGNPLEKRPPLQTGRGRPGGVATFPPGFLRFLSGAWGTGLWAQRSSPRSPRSAPG